MTETSRRLWGIDLIAALYGFVGAMIAAAYFTGLLTNWIFALVVCMICGIICLGCFLRINAIRIVMVGVLGASLVLQVMIFMYYFDALIGLTDAPPSRDPLKMLLRTSLRMAISYAMFRYLRRDDVRDAFAVRKEAVIAEPCAGLGDEGQ